MLPGWCPSQNPLALPAPPLAHFTICKASVGGDLEGNPSTDDWTIDPGQKTRGGSLCHGRIVVTILTGRFY
jgi:hypothetical protein